MMVGAASSYKVKEIFKTLQGEGHYVGRTAVFCRFTGCNLWSGREVERSKASCRFCDTDFRGGERYQDLPARIAAAWGRGPKDRFVVLTGGEPLLQVDAPLIGALHTLGFYVAVETNGAITPPTGLDWICVSPKVGTPLRVTSGSELKLVFPQVGVTPDVYTSMDFKYFLLQPLDGPARIENTAAAINYCLQHPKWRLSLQTHKLIGMP